MLKKSTVLIVGPYPPPYGGIAVFVRDLLNSPVKDHFNLLFLRTAKRASEEMPFVKKLAREIKDTLSLVRYLLKEKNLKIVHIHTPSYLGFWRHSIHVLISKMFGKKVVLHILGGGFKDFYEGGWRLQKWYIRNILSVSDKIVALSSMWKSFFSTLTDPNQIIVAPTAIYYQDFDIKFNKKKEILTEFGIPTNRIICISLGGLIKEKGILEVLNAADTILSDKAKENIYFVFAGKGILEDEVRRYCKRFQSNAKYLGGIASDRKIKLLSSSDIFLLPSHIEGIPIALLEAMASGLAVITTPVGGIPEVIKDGENGFLIKPGDINALKGKILTLASNNELREEMGRRNRELVKEKYSWDVVAEKIVGIYNEVIKES